MNFKKTYLFTTYLLILIGLLSGSVLINGCKKKGTVSAYKLTGDSILDGKNLAQINCSKCHALVPVNALDKNVWMHHTLPAMAHRVGVSTYGESYYKSDKDTGGLSLIEWESIVAYYQKMSPDTLRAAKGPVPLNNDWAGFKLKTPAPGKHYTYTTMAAFNPYNHKIYTSDNVFEQLTQWDSNLKLEASTILPSTAVDATFFKDASGVNQGLLTCIGKMDPTDIPVGKVININLDAKTGTSNQTTAADVLARPVQTVTGDFNKDGLTDMVILAQGKSKGGVYLYQQNANHTFTQINVSDKQGAVQAVAGDFNNDGWQDLMVLYGNGDEGLWLYLNNHKGGFTAKNLLHFPPVYGSTSFQLADMDHDGKLDLIYTCGYNFRDSRILKPYHGLYIFKNTGDWNFKQQYFYPINGCTKAIAADFDGDGDLDIATSAYFADMQTNPAESFIYFEQISPFNFKAHAIPISKYGRWMTMEVADYNGDGKPDIILGNYSTGFLFQLGFKPFWNQFLPFVVLENNFKK